MGHVGLKDPAFNSLEWNTPLFNRAVPKLWSIGSSNQSFSLDEVGGEEHPDIEIEKLITIQ